MAKARATTAVAKKADSKPAVKAAVEPATKPAKTANAKPATNGTANTGPKKRKASSEPVEDSDVESAPSQPKKVKKAAPTTKAATTKTAAVTKKAAPAKKPTAASASKKASVNGTSAASAAPTKTKANGTLKAAQKSLAPPAPPASKKRKSPSPEPDQEDDSDQDAVDISPPEPAAKKAKVAAKKPTAARASKSAKKPRKVINVMPTQKLDVFVFGEGSSGELGLGSKKINGKKPIDVKRPRLNGNLSASTVGVVQIATGGMHAAALTHDNKILTWGVNDQGSLGRDTTWDGGLRDADAEDSDSDDDDDDTGLNPKESMPTEIHTGDIPEGTRFVQIVASDSATFALTDDGHVWGWGTFRASEGILGFTEKIRIQMRPMLIEGLKDIKQLAAGSNHILALSTKGDVLAWGSGQQNQLARRIIERNKLTSLTPQGVGLPKGKIEKVACGSYHSFAVGKDGSVWAWGLNNFAETGIPDDAGSDDAVILRPTKVAALSNYRVVDIAGGEHHSVACSEAGELLTWGRLDGHQVGVKDEVLTEEDAIYDERGNPRILLKPAVIPEISAALVAAGTDNSFAIDKEGRAFAWGFSTNYQTGLGTTEDVVVPTLIDNTAVHGKKLIYAGGGGQFSILAGIPQDAALPNGTSAH